MPYQTKLFNITNRFNITKKNKQRCMMNLLETYVEFYKIKTKKNDISSADIVNNFGV
ncbi:MAG: hypothetical protein JJV99_06755 [Colwellia sp.]|nr:hypothetical protein [Colwellia sp.]